MPVKSTHALLETDKTTLLLSPCTQVITEGGKTDHSQHAEPKPAGFFIELNLRNL
jgi:hypothetical protein